MKTYKTAREARLLIAAVLAFLLAVPGAVAEPDPDRLPAAPPAPRTAFDRAPDKVFGPGRDPRTLVVKLADDGGVAVVEGRLVTATIDGSAKAATAVDAVDIVNEVLDLLPAGRVERLFQLPVPLLELLRRAGESRSGVALADLSQFFVVHVGDREAGELMLRELLAQPAVETAYARLKLRSPVDVPPTTPNFENGVGPGQGYRDPAPAGIDVAAAWSRGYAGAGVTVADLELSWNLLHEDLDHLWAQTPPVPILPPGTWSTAAADVDHGTATLGVLASGNNGYGTTGLVPDATLRVMPVDVAGSSTWNGANSVVVASLYLRPGDVMLLEAELARGPFTNVPFETDPAEYAAVAQATALGIHVIEPAGNTTGGLNLDTSSLVLDPVTGRSFFDRYYRDSGAVLVGAGASAVTQGLHAVYPNSNVGSRVDTYSWGQNVTTLGYGPRTFASLSNCANPVDPFPQAPDQNQYYTYCFNGTSSAGAIVAGAAAMLEEKHRTDFGRPFSTRELRNHLSLGTGSLGVGHQPDLAYQIDFMDGGGIIAHLFESPPVPNQSRPELGKAVAGGGDADGDGRDDVIVGIPGFAVPLATGGYLPEAGRVYVFSGATGRVLYELDGSQSGERFGAAVTIAGDADFDGLADFAVGAPGDATGGLDAGKVEIYSGRTGQQLVTPFLGAAGERYGAAVAWVGNVNPTAEPFDDLLIGAPGAGSGAGRSELVNLVHQVLHSAAGANSDEFGAAVAAAGDLDGDGVPDLLVGAPGFWNGTANPAGAAYAYSGATGQQLMSAFGHPTAALISPQRFGAAVAGAGDFDGDGWNDVVVGAPKGTFIPGGEFGRVDVLRRNGALIASFDGGHPRDNLGSGVAGVGDFDGDGYADVALGSPNQNGMLAGRPGRVRVVLGGPPSGTPPVWNERLFHTLDDGTGWGASVAAAGDVNGDGLADVLAGEPNGENGGRAFVFTAGPGPDPLAGQPRLIAFVPALEAHDVDGNGNSGGGRSPETTTFVLDAGPAWAGADYAVVGVPDVGGFLMASRGVLDGQGLTAAPVFGPFPAGLLCGGIGFRFGFLGAALRDLNGDGIYDQLALSNFAEVEVINEYAPLCQ